MSDPIQVLLEALERITRLVGPFEHTTPSTTCAHPVCQVDNALRAFRASPREPERTRLEPWAMDALRTMAERWERTPEWHPNFHDGKINVTTRELHAASIIARHLSTPRSAPGKDEP